MSPAYSGTKARGTANQSRPAPWIFGLTGLISVLAGIIYSSLSARIAAQEKIIGKLQEDIARISQGCGHGGCYWKAAKDSKS